MRRKNDSWSRILRSSKIVLLLVAVLLCAGVGIQGTLAFLSTKTAPVQNTFTPSAVSCAVDESFDGTTKRNVNVINTGDTTAYLRVKLVSYRVNRENQRIGGTAAIPELNLGNDWITDGTYYYYTNPVAPGEKPASNLVASILLQDCYDDADGGRQVIDVMAEAIQAEPKSAVAEAWGNAIAQQFN